MAHLDPQYEQHYRTWVGFTRFLRWNTAAVIIILILLAIFLL